MNERNRKPCVEVLGLLECDGPAIRRARRWRALWELMRAAAVFGAHCAALPFLIAAAVTAWVISLPRKRGRAGEGVTPQRLQFRQQPRRTWFPLLRTPWFPTPLTPPHRGEGDSRLRPALQVQFGVLGRLIG